MLGCAMYEVYDRGSFQTNPVSRAHFITCRGGKKYQSCIILSSTDWKWWISATKTETYNANPMSPMSSQLFYSSYKILIRHFFTESNTVSYNIHTNPTSHNYSAYKIFNPSFPHGTHHDQTCKKKRLRTYCCTSTGFQKICLDEYRATEKMAPALYQCLWGPG